jgi:hypothetical protein
MHEATRLDNSAVPVVAGLAVGVAFMLIILVVAGSLATYGNPFYGSTALQIVTDGEDLEDVDGCCDVVATLQFDHELKLTTEENDH